MKNRNFYNIIALFTFVILTSGIVHAQASTDEVARRLVGEGIEAAKVRDWITARKNFEKAYEIQPLPLTLYNLAAAQQKSGQLVEADRSYRIFLRETTPGQNDDFRQASINARNQLRDQICFVVVSIPNLHSDDVLTVADREIAHAILGESIPTNPGSLFVDVTRDGQNIKRQEFTLRPGSTRNIVVPIPKKTVLTNTTNSVGGNNGNNQVGQSNTNNPGAGGSVGEDEGGSGALWVAAGVVGVLAVAGGVGAIFAFTPGPGYDSTLPAVEVSAR